LPCLKRKIFKKQGGERVGKSEVKGKQLERKAADNLLCRESEMGNFRARTVAFKVN